MIVTFDEGGIYVSGWLGTCDIKKQINCSVIDLIKKNPNDVQITNWWENDTVAVVGDHTITSIFATIFFTTSNRTISDGFIQNGIDFLKKKENHKN